MSAFMYRPANEIKPGDILPDASTAPVLRVVEFPNESILITFRGTSFTKRFYHGGPDYGWSGVSIERAP